MRLRKKEPEAMNSRNVIVQKAMLEQRLLDYEILEQVGEGGMRVVYKALDTHLERMPFFRDEEIGWRENK